MCDIPILNHEASKDRIKKLKEDNYEIKKIKTPNGIVVLKRLKPQSKIYAKKKTS